MSFLGGLALNFVGGLLGGRSQREQQRRMLAQQRQINYDAYSNAIKDTPEEIAYRKRLQERADVGDPDLAKRQRMMMSPILQQGQTSRASATGLAIRQGLENSIIAHQIRSKVDAKTLQSITQTAEKIAMYNDQYKRQYEDRLDQYQMQKSQRLRDLSTSYIQNKPIDTTMTDGEMFGSLFGQMMSGVSSGWMNSESGQASMNDFFSGMFDW